MRLGKRTAAVVVSAFAITATVSGAANADGLHLSDPNQYWQGGCEATYSLDARVDAQFGGQISNALNYISPYTGIRFSRLANGDASANLRYTSTDDLSAYGKDVAGIGSTDGSIQLLDTAKVVDLGSPTANNYLRTNLLIHETLHAVGLGHDDDNGSAKPDEIMNPMLPVGPVFFGNGDLTGMEYIRTQNDCSITGLTPPTPTSKVVPPASAVPTWRPFLSKSVTVIIPTRVMYIAKSYRTVITGTKKIKATAKSDGRTVMVKFTSGWKKVPYTYRKTTNSLVYSEAQRLRLDIASDPLGAAVAQYVG